MNQDTNQSSVASVHSAVSSSTMKTSVISPKLPLERLEESNSLADNNDDLFARLTDYFPDLFTPKGLSSLRSGATPRAWTTPRTISFPMEESSLVSSPVDWVTGASEEHSALGSNIAKDNAPNWIREFTSTWNIISQDRNEKSPKKRVRQVEANSSIYDSFPNTADEGDNLSISNDSSCGRERLLDLKDVEYSGSHSTGSASQSYNTNSHDNNPISDDHTSNIETHETRTVKRRGRKRKHPEMVSWYYWLCIYLSHTDKKKTEEERKAYRAMQNRRSAERSRQRKKVRTYSLSKGPIHVPE